MAERPLALITGGSGGIGFELAKLFAGDNYDLVIAARNEQKLQQAAAELTSRFKVKVDTFSVDLADVDGPGELASAMGGRIDELTALVNNAGYGMQGPFLKTDIDVEVKMVQTNITSLMQLTKLAAPGMVKRGSGYILNVGSTAGFQPGPNMAVYYASKAFVNSFSQALGAELKGTGVKVSCLCPGPVETDFQARANFAAGKLFKMKAAIVPASEVALEAYRGMKDGKSIVIPGFVNKLGNFGQRFLSRDAVTKMTGNLNEVEPGPVS
ncbi:MAG: SDR family NAD(P)-dependent oxidoreductase [Myxococcaceae bacterium]